MKRGGKCVLLAGALLILAQCASQPPPDFSETEWFDRTQTADRESLHATHKTPDGAFFNPWLERESVHRSGSWFFHDKKEFEKFGEDQYKAVENDFAYLLDENFDSISFGGHASFIIKMNNQTIFTDPFFSRAALIKPKKFKMKFDYSKVPQRPVVLISHNHYDHLDKTTVKKLVKNDPIFIVPLGVKSLIVDYGGKEVYELDWWENISLDSITYTLVPAQHWSRRLGKGQESGLTLWGGYIIEGSKTIYFSGDTGYFIGFKEFGEKWDIDYAIMGAGAYEPRWFMHYSHMNVEEFLKAAADLKAKYSTPMHFGAISLSDEPLLYPLYEIDKAINQNPELAEKILPMRVGEFIQLSGSEL